MRAITIALMALFLPACNIGYPVFHAYPGEPRSELQVATVSGAQYVREDWINRYVDAVRFTSIDDNRVDASREFSSVAVMPGFREVTVYFHWDVGIRRGLAQALVSYAASRETLSRTLRFNARAGENYTVHAEPVFKAVRDHENITAISHVDFWVEDGSGNVVVSREQGRYIPAHY